MKKLELKWNVFAHHIGEKEIEIYNIFEHGRFLEDVKKDLRKYDIKEEFAERLRGHLFYYFGSKCEWEVVISSFPAYIKKEELNRLNNEFKTNTERYGHEPYSIYINPNVGKKVDVYEQVQLNFDIFIDYVWSFKRKINRKEK